MSVYDITASPINVRNLKKDDIINCPYSGSSKEITLPKGIYKLECWGAQGGYRSNSSYGGKGGYSVGTLTLNSETKLFLYSGGLGSKGSGGFNGGGSRTAYPGGGGGTDIRIGQDSLYARVIVAGGGGSDGASNKTGMYGGGTSGGTTTEYYGTGGGGGTQTSGGAGGSGNAGTFGTGGEGLSRSNGYGGAGGGGWYGGGGSYPDGSGDDDKGGGGGSGYVYTANTASNYPKGCILNSSYYLTDAETIAGNQSITSPDGSITTGNSGNGYIRITVIELEQLPLWIKENNVWIKGNKLYEKNNGIWRLLESSQIENTINAKKIKKPKYVWKKFENEEDNHTLLLISDTLEDRVGGHSITNNGVELSTNQSKFGGSSLYFGGNQYLTINDVSLCNGSGDWTVDWWEYRTAAIGNTGTISRNGNNDNYSGLLLGYVDSIDGTLKFYASNNSSSWNMVDSMASGFPTLNQWIHRCVVRSSNTFYAFENGILKGSANSSKTFSFTKPINIGYYLGGCFSGYMNEIRISDIARWTENFTPPTKPYNYTLIGYIESENSNAYPDDGLADDGYYYKRL